MTSTPSGSSLPTTPIFRRHGVKTLDRSDRESSLQRLRHECAERFEADRASLRSQLRNRDWQDVIRNGIRSVRRIATPDGLDDGLADVDIDRLVEEFLSELVKGDDDHMAFSDGCIPEEMEYEEEPIPNDGVRCPVCLVGWILIPVPGVLACDHCAELRLRVASEGFTLHDLATSLDLTIRNHQNSGCVHQLKFKVDNNVLFAICSQCNLLEVVI